MHNNYDCGRLSSRAVCIRLALLPYDTITINPTYKYTVFEQPLIIRFAMLFANGTTRSVVRPAHDKVVGVYIIGSAEKIHLYDQ